MKTPPLDKRYSGSTVLERGTHWLSRQIIKHMELYAKQTHREPLSYSHAETLLWNEEARYITLYDKDKKPYQYFLQEQTMYTVGSRGEGNMISPAREYYGDTEILVMAPETPLTDLEIDAQWQHFISVSWKKYQKGNFLNFILYFKLAWFLGSKKDIRDYCYELAAEMQMAANRWYRGRGCAFVLLYDLYENQRFNPL